MQRVDGYGDVKGPNSPFPLHTLNIQPLEETQKLDEQLLHIEGMKKIPTSTLVGNAEVHSP